MPVDFLVVGTGVYGATVTRELANSGASCLVIERREHIAGNCYDEEIMGILVNRYGGHIFHTNSKRVWQYVNRFAEWQQYEHRVKVWHDGKVYSFPPNQMTYQQLGTDDEAEIRRIFFDGYTQKQWGKPIEEVPKSVLARIPKRSTWDDRYFGDKYQGMPVGGYTQMVIRMLQGIPIYMEADYLKDKSYWNRQAHHVIYSGSIDELFDCQYGKLEYRSLRYEHEQLDIADFQGCATMNYPGLDVDYTRIMEWKHFRYQNKDNLTIISREYPQSEGEPFYPVNDDINNGLYRMYRAMVDNDKWLTVGGRLGSYQYLNMDQAIAAGLQTARKLL